MSDGYRSDRDLIEAVRAGNMAAFRTLFETYYASLCSFAFCIVKRRDMADDVCSRVFENLWHKREELRISTNIRGYLFSSVRNCSLNQLASERAARSTSMDHPEAEKELTEHRTAKDYLNEIEFEKEIRRLLGGMPEQRRTAFILSRFDQLRYREIASIMGLTERTVQNHIVLAVKELEDHLPQLREYLN